jgi:hypothetical protein
MASVTVMLLSAVLLTQAQSGEPGKQRGSDETTRDPSTREPKENVNRDPHGAEKADPAAAGTKEVVPNPDLPYTPRGSGDLPTINTVYGQQSPTYEDVTGARKILPGVLPGQGDPVPSERDKTY